MTEKCKVCSGKIYCKKEYRDKCKREGCDHCDKISVCPNCLGTGNEPEPTKTMNEKQQCSVAGCQEKATRKVNLVFSLKPGLSNVSDAKLCKKHWQMLMGNSLPVSVGCKVETPDQPTSTLLINFENDRSWTKQLKDNLI